MVRILVAYALSGFIGLGYQVAWFRIFTDWFGSTTLTFALVVCNFICGLGVGALLSRRVSGFLGRRLGMTDALRIYGVIEIGIFWAALLTLMAALIPPDLFGSFPYELRGDIWEPSPGYQAAQILIAAACVFVPCVFMGMTFPLLCNVFVNEPQGGRFPARLYAWNTLGACTGILVCQFVFLRWIGHGPTYWLTLTLNLLLGLYFLNTGGAPASARLPPPVFAAQSTVAPAGERSGAYATLLILACVSGFLAGALEGDLFKRVSFLVGAAPGATMTFVSFWAVLAIFLASTAVHRLTALRLAHIKLAFIAAVGWYVVVWNYRYQIADLVEGSTPVTWFPSSMLVLFLFAGAFTFVPYFLISLLLPFVCNRLQADRRHLGVAYGLNTLAFCAGLLVFCMAAPSVNIFYSLLLSMAALGLGALFLVSIPALDSTPRWQIPLFVALTAAAIYFTPRGFDRNAFYPNEPTRTRPVAALMANASHTTFVLDWGVSDLRLYFDSHSMSGTNLPSQKYMRLMAHVPLLMQARPEKALLICFGVGNTASAIGAHESIRQIDIVDLNRNVFLTAPVFESTHGNIQSDPRVRLINDDGRSYLRKSGETYDLITSEPPPPLGAGVYRLYSKEYYEAALEHLSEDGMMSQWLPIYQLPREAADLVITTFVAVFPHTLLFSGAGDELVLVGGRRPLSMEDAIAAIGRDPRVVRDLASIEVDSPNDLRLRVVAEDGHLRRLFGTGPVLRDQHNDLEHLFLSPENQATYERVEDARRIARSGP